MTDIIDRLRQEVAWEPEIGSLLQEAADEIGRLRLTDSERVALNWAIATLETGALDAGQNAESAGVLSGMVERLT